MIDMIQSGLAAQRLTSLDCDRALISIGGPLLPRQQRKYAFFMPAAAELPVVTGALVLVPTQQITDKGGLCGPQPWRDRSVPI